MSAVSALIHFAGRYPCVLISPGEKGPKGKDWPNKRATPAQVDRAIRAGHNIGIILGRPSNVIDLEIDGEGGEDSLRKLFDGEPPETPAWQSARGIHRLYLWDDRFAGLGAKFEHADFPGLEFRIGDEAAQSVCPPSTVDGVKREWIHEGEPAKLPDAVIERIVALGRERKSQQKPVVVSDSPFGNLQAKKVADLLAWMDRYDVPGDLDGKNDAGAYKITFGGGCPRRGHDDGNAVIYINDDGSIVFHCFHAKCQGATFADLEAKFGPFNPPSITIDVDLHRVVAEGTRALCRADDIFNRGGILMQLVNAAPLPKYCLNDNGAPRLRPIPGSTLTMLLSEHARWHTKSYTKKGVKLKRVPPPQQIASAIKDSHDLPGIRVITGIVSSPMLRADGSIALRQGYDKQTGLCLDIDGDWPAPMSVAEAVRWFDDIFCDFPFAEPAHKSACIAAPVTMVSRHAFAGPAPCIAFVGNAPRLGKGLATDAITIAAEGRKATRMSFSEDDAEMRKVITSAAIAGSAYVLFDNVKGKFGGKSLEGAMTAGRWSDRILGTNQTIDVAFNPVWLATANNATITPDMVGRLLMCKLHTSEENPGARTGFRHPDLLAYVKQHRRELVMAALSIPYHYMRAGRPKQAINNWGGFDEWNNLVRASLVWAGLPDPDTRAQVTEESDEESSILRQLLEAWPKGFWPVAAICKLLQTGSYSDNDPYPALREAVAELPGHDKAAALGRVLRDSRGRVLNGKRFIREGGKNGRKWAVESV